MRGEMRAALSIVLTRCVALRVRGAATPVSGRGAVRLECAICATTAPAFGVESRLFGLVLRHEGSDLTLALTEASPSDLATEEVLHYLEGYHRYVALARTPYLMSLSLSDLVELFEGRPHELWYAMQDANVSPTFETLAVLPYRAVLDVLTSGPPCFDVSGRGCERFLDLLRPEDALQFLATNAPAVPDHGYLGERYGGDTTLLRDMVLLLSETRGHVPSLEFVGDHLRREDVSVVLLRTGLLDVCTREWIAQHVARDQLYVTLVIGGLLGDDADWLADSVAPRDLLAALSASDLLPGLTPEWLAARLPAGDVVAAMRGKWADISADWIAENVPRDDAGRALDQSGNLVGRDLAWIVDRVPPEHVFLCASPLLVDRTPDWIFDHVSPGFFAMRALIVHGGLARCDREWIVRRFSGADLRAGLEHLGMDLGATTPPAELLSQYGSETVSVLVALGRHGAGQSGEELEATLDGLAPALGERRMAELLGILGPDDPDLVARYLSGGVLLKYLMEHGLIVSAERPWLVGRLDGFHLVAALDAAGYLEHPAVTVEDLRCALEGGALFEAILLSPHAATLAVGDCIDMFGGLDGVLERALHLCPDLYSADPSEIHAAFRDKRRAKSLVYRTAVYDRMDPADMCLYGVE